MQQWKSSLRRFIFLIRIFFFFAFSQSATAFKNGDKVQAFDPVLGQWLNGTVLDVDNGGRVLIHWAGYTRYFDAWLDALEVRKPEGERPLDRRRPVLKSNFPKR